MNFFLKIFVPDGLYFEGDVYQIDLKTTSGNIGVLANHMPLVSSLDIGQLTITSPNQSKQMYALHGGILNITKKVTTIITFAIEKASAIDKRRAKLAQIKAQQILENKINYDSKKLKSAELALKKALIRLKT